MTLKSIPLFLSNSRRLSPSSPNCLSTEKTTLSDPKHIRCLKISKNKFQVELNGTLKRYLSLFFPLFFLLFSLLFFFLFSLFSLLIVSCGSPWKPRGEISSWSESFHHWIQDCETLGASSLIQSCHSFSFLLFLLISFSQFLFFVSLVNPAKIGNKKKQRK